MGAHAEVLWQEGRWHACGTGGTELSLGEQAC